MSRTFAGPRQGGALLWAAAAVAAGLSAGAGLVPASGSGGAIAAAPVTEPGAAPSPGLRAGHPAEVLRVIDGDTFEARVRVWPGMDVTTRVRLRGIDAPELHARCEAERKGALAARAALAQILAQGDVGVSDVGQDKYGGRVDTAVSTAGTRDVSVAMLNGGFARAYHGGRRRGWCG